MLGESPCNVLKSVSGFLRGQENSLLIDKPEVMQTLRALQIAFDNLPASESSENIKSNNPMSKIKELIAQFNVISGVPDSRNTVGGYEEGNNPEETVKNKDNYKKEIKIQFDKTNVFREVSNYTRANWNNIQKSAGILCDKNQFAPMLGDNSIKNHEIRGIFSNVNKEKTLSVLEAIGDDIMYKNREAYAKRLGIESVRVSTAR